MPVDHSDERSLIGETAARLLERSAELERPTVAELLRNTGLPRWKLTHRHRDLNDEFLAAVGRKWGFDDASRSAEKTKFEELKAKHERLRKENSDLKSLVQSYAEIIEELRIQNFELSGKTESRVKPIRQLSDDHRREP